MRLICRSILLSAALLAANLGIAQDKPDQRTKFMLAKETTSIAEPLTKEGYPDYPRALNEMFSAGITTENNANVLFWQAYGPHPEGESMPAEFFEMMGMDAPAEDGRYFADIASYLKTKGAAADRFEIAMEQQRKAQDKPWKAEDYPEVVDWLTANETPLALVIAGTKRSKFFSPFILSTIDRPNRAMFGAPFSGLQSARAVARALFTRAMLHVSDGEADKAWQDLLSVHRQARLIAQGPTMIDGLVGIGMETSAIKSDLELLENSRLSRRQIEAYQRDLNGLQQFPVMAEKIDVCERFTMLDALLLLESGNSSSLAVLTRKDGSDTASGTAIKILGDAIDWDTVLTFSNSWYDRYTHAMRAPKRGQRAELFSELDRDLDVMIKHTTDQKNILKLAAFPDEKKAGEMVGGIMLGLLLPAFESVMNAEDRIKQEYRHLQLAMALAAYRADHDRYPKVLDELAPRFIAEVPGDLFTGKPLAYRPSEEGYLLYSLGPNGKDDSSNASNAAGRGDDIVVRVPSQE